MEDEEAITFLSWIGVGINFKKEAADIAKKSGLDPVVGQVGSGGGAKDKKNNKKKKK